MPDYGFEHEGRIFTPNQTEVSKEENDARNVALEAEELWTWHIRMPERCSAYISSDGKTLTTWNGTKLGDVFWAKCGHLRQWSPWHGEHITAYRIRGTNGATYYGRSSAGMIIHLRRMKNG